MVRRHTRKQRGGGGGQSKGNVEEGGGGGGGGGGGAAAPAPVPTQDPEEDAIVSIIYLLTLLRGGSVEEQKVYTDMLSYKEKITTIVSNLKDTEEELRAQLEPIQANLQSTSNGIKAPFSRVRAGSLTNNNRANKKAASIELRRLNTSQNAETVRRLHTEINGLYTRHGADIREMESNFYQNTLKKLEGLFVLPEFSRANAAKRESLKEGIFGQRSILYDDMVHRVTEGYLHET